MVGDAGLDRGIQRVTYRKGGNTGHVTVLVVADTAYVRGDVFALTNYMGFSAARAASLAGHWLQIPHTARGYATVAAAVRLKSTLSELVLPRPRLALPETTRDGQRVLGIRSNTRPLASVSPTPCMSVRRDRCCRLPRSHTEARIG